MAGVEGFRDVGRGEFDQDSLASFRGIFRVFEAQEFVLSEGLFSSEDRRDEEFGELGNFEEELEECAGHCWFMDKGGFRELWQSHELVAPSISCNWICLPSLPIPQLAPGVSCP